jgi:hypothetical protein
MSEKKKVFIVVYTYGESYPLIPEVAYNEKRKAIAFVENKKLIYPHRAYFILESCFV